MDVDTSMLLLLAFATGGCGDEGELDASVDGAIDASTDARVVTITPPTPPTLPVFTPCPDGWYEIEEDGIAVCEPWPETGRADCAEHEAHFPGRPGCERIGSECPAAGNFSPDIPAGSTVVYVREGETGGTGSEDAPYGMIAEALSGISPGTVVALAAGTYDETVELTDGVTLLGACAQSTHLVSTTVSAPDPVVRIVGADTRIENVTVGPAGGLGIRATGLGPEITVRDVIVRDVTSVGVLVEHESIIDAERLVIRRTSTTSSGLFGRGLDIEDDAVADVRWLSSENNHEFGVVSLRAQLTVNDAASVGTRPTATSGGPGFGALDGRLTARRVVSENNADVAILAIQGGANIDLEDVVARDTVPNPARNFGGRAFVAQEGASATCRRCRFQRSKEIAMMVTGSQATFEDLLVTDVERRESDQQVGRGISVRDEGSAEIHRMMIRRVHSEGILVIGESTLTATDVDIRDVRLVSGYFGRAMIVVDGSTVTMERWEASELPEAGFLFQDPRTVVTMRDILLHDVHSREVDGRGGRGVNIQIGASVAGERIAIRDVRDVGLAVLSPDTHVDLTDVSIGPVLSVACGDTTCSDDPAGHGFGVYEMGNAQLSRFEVAEADLCGVHIADGASASIENGTVRGSTIGACVQSEAQDLADLSRSVRYLDNDDELVSTNLPVPGTLVDMDDTGTM